MVDVKGDSALKTFAMEGCVDERGGIRNKVGFVTVSIFSLFFSLWQVRIFLFTFSISFLFS